MLFRIERIFVQTIIPIAINKVEPTVTLVEIKHLLFVCQGKSLQLTFHREIGGHIVETSDGTGIGHGCGMLAIIITSLAAHHLLGIEIVQACGVIIAVESATVIVRKAFEKICLCHIQTMQ